MDDVVQALAAQHHELDSLLEPLTTPAWQLPSRCPGWTLSDVLLHLAQTDELTVASGQGRFAGAVARFRGDGDVNVDQMAAAAVDRERGAPGPAVLHRWRAAAAAVRALFDARDPRDRLEWVTGPLPVRTLATTRLAETWIHTGDIAPALDVDLPATDRLWHIARLAWRTLPYAFARAGQTLQGPVGMALDAPDGSTWEFGLDLDPLTIVSGPALEFCLVAARRLDPRASALVAEGPDAQALLALVRTYA